jgi:hypothetical protein
MAIAGEIFWLVGLNKIFKRLTPTLTIISIKKRLTVATLNTMRRDRKMKFNLFRKPKEPEQKADVPTEEQPKTENTTEPVVAPEETKEEAPASAQEPTPEPQPTPEATPEPETPAQEVVQPSQEQKQEAPTEPATKTYLKAMPLKDLADIDNVKNEVKKGNIIILRVTPLATKSIEDVKTAVNELYEFADAVGGDIARLGEERVVICPKKIRIWREKSPVSTDKLPTSAPTAA